MPVSLKFLGAARTVTGSKYLLDTGKARILIDAGLFQGLKELRELNWREFPVPASSLDAVVLTHAHLDHCGYLPRLVMQGFKGRVFCTAGTRDLCRIVLPDSGRIQEEDAANANRHGYSRHAPALPLYGEADAFRAVSLLQPVGYERAMPVAEGIEVDFLAAGHLLGSAYARVRTE
jgi:metallo-beta-lactamase family protein